MSEYIKGEWRKLKGQPLKVRLAYFWEYYKWHVLAVLLVVFLIGYTVITQVNRKDAVLYGILVNSNPVAQDTAFLQAFCEENGVDQQEQEVVFLTGLYLQEENPSTNIVTYQRVQAGVAAADTDCLAGTEYVMQQFGYDVGRMLQDLRTVLTPQQLQQLEGRLYYIDAGMLYNQQPEAEKPLPSPFAPETMADPVPVAIDISGCKDFTSVYYAPDAKVYLAVMKNAPHLDMTARFIAALLEEMA